MQNNISHNILILDKYFKLYFKKSLKVYNLNAAEGFVLLMLCYKHNYFDPQVSKSYFNHLGITQEQLIEKIHYDKSVIARTMQSLEEKGYVKRTENPADNRSSLFQITEKTNDLKEVLYQILKDWNESLLADIPDEAVDTLNTYLDKMVTNAINKEFN